MTPDERLEQIRVAKADYIRRIQQINTEYIHKFTPLRVGDVVRSILEVPKRPIGKIVSIYMSGTDCPVARYEVYTKEGKPYKSGKRIDATLVTLLEAVK